MHQPSDAGGQIVLANRRFAVAQASEATGTGVNACPSSGNMSRLICRSTAYPALNGSPLNDDLAAIDVGADIKGPAQAVIYQSLHPSRKRHVQFEAYGKIFRVEANEPQLFALLAGLSLRQEKGVI